MADWKKLCKQFILADGYIEEKETDLIKAEILADGVVNKSEAEFLIDLRKSAPKAVQKFHLFVFEVVKKAILADGEISAAEAAWLQKFLLADGKVDDTGEGVPDDLKDSAKKTCPEFDAMVKKYGDLTESLRACELRKSFRWNISIPCGSCPPRRGRPGFRRRPRELEPVAREPARHAHLRVRRVHVDHEVPVRCDRVHAHLPLRERVRAPGCTCRGTAAPRRRPRRSTAQFTPSGVRQFRCPVVAGDLQPEPVDRRAARRTARRARRR